MRVARIYGAGIIVLVFVLAISFDRPAGDRVDTGLDADVPQTVTTTTFGYRAPSIIPAAGPDSRQAALHAQAAGPEIEAGGHGTGAAFHRENRLDTIAAIGTDRSRRAALALRSLLDDPDLAVREEAVEALAARGGPGVIAGLAYALSDTEVLVRRLAIEGLAADGGDAAIGALALVLYDLDPGLRRLTVDELAERDSAAARLVLQLFVADPDPAIRSLAETYLGGNCRASHDDPSCPD